MARLNHWPRQEGHHPALRLTDRAVSWQQLKERITAVAVGFIVQGVRAGCGVALKANNSEMALVAYLALLQCGARLLPLNPRLPSCQLAALLPSLNVDFALTLNGEPLENIAALQFLPQAGLLKYRPDEENIATLTLTSGSNGRPKAAAHTLRAHLASAHGVVTKLNFKAEDSWLLSLPLYHVSGQGIIWRWLYSGGTLVLPEERSLPVALEDCTFASLVPAQLWRLLKQSHLPRGLRTVLLGGATIPEALTLQAETRGIACWCGYGMTETASTVAAKRADGFAGVGQALAGHHIRLVEGEVQLQSEALACGYWQNGQLLPLTDSEGWFHTRDGGRWMAEELLIIGRLDNQFFSAGEGIQPELVEAVLKAHPAVEQVFIVPQHDEEFGQRPVALVRLNPCVSLAELQIWAAPQLASFQRPVCWYKLPELDHGGIKISRQKLTEWVARQGKGNQGDQ